MNRFYLCAEREWAVTNLEQKKRFLLNAGFFALLGGLAILLFYLLPLLLPFLIGFVLAKLTQPAARIVARRTPLKEKPAHLLCLGLFLAVVSLAATFLVVFLAEGLSGLLKEIPVLLSGLPEAVRSLYQRLIALANGISPELALRLADMAASLTEEAGRPSQWLVDVLGYLYHLLTGVPAVFLSVGVSLVSAFLFAADLPLVDSLLSRIPLPFRKDAFVGGALRSAGRLFKAYGILTLATFAQILLGLWLMKMDYAFTLALLIAAVDLLPVFGAGTVLVPWALLSMVLGNTHQGALLFLLYGIISAVRSILEPRLIGKGLGLPAFVTLPCVFIGLRLGGILGMFALPVAVILCVRFWQWRNKKEGHAPQEGA